jgi:uncharacterized membrane protein
LTVESNRTLGTVAACLTLVGAVGSIASIVRFAYPDSLAVTVAVSGVSSIVGAISFVGFILFLVAMYGFSRDYQERRIFNYILYGIAITIAAAAVAGVVFFAYLMANMSSIISGISPNPSQSDILASISPYLAPAIGIFGFVSLIYVVFTVRSFNLLSDKSEVPLFRSGARLLLLGAILTIVIAIVVAAVAADAFLSVEGLAVMVLPGGLVQYLGWTVLALAYRRIKPPKPAYTSYTAPQTSTVAASAQGRYCPHCGAPNLPDAHYCGRCGQKLP